MCLIVIALKQHPDWPFVMVANRDEFFARPTQPLGFWPDAPIVAGRDLRAGGTWMGFNRNGRFAALTNFRNGREPNTGGSSRGRVVAHYLMDSAPAAHYVAPADVRSGYNLIRGDSEGLFYSGNRGGDFTRLNRGVHTLSNALLESEWPKTRCAHSTMKKVLREEYLNGEKLIRVLSDETRANDDQLPDTGIPLEKERLLSSCLIRSPDYGTRATTVVMQAANGDTRIIEQRMDNRGRCGRSDFKLWLRPLGL